MYKVGEISYAKFVPAPAMAAVNTSPYSATALFPSSAATPAAASVDAFSLVSEDLAAMTQEIHAELEESES